MSDKQRWQYGLTNIVTAAVDAKTVINLGDLLYQYGGKAFPVQTDEKGNAWELKIVKAELLTALQLKNFLGVAMQRSWDGDTSPIRTATTGVFELDCVTIVKGRREQVATFEIGAPIGMVGNQIVCYSPLVTDAIGRVAKRESEPVSTVYVCIRSRVMGIHV